MDRLRLRGKWGGPEVVLVLNRRRPAQKHPRLPPNSVDDHEVGTAAVAISCHSESPNPADPPYPPPQCDTVILYFAMAPSVATPASKRTTSSNSDRPLLTARRAEDNEVKPYVIVSDIGSFATVYRGYHEERPSSSLSPFSLKYAVPLVQDATCNTRHAPSWRWKLRTTTSSRPLVSECG